MTTRITPDYHLFLFRTPGEAKSLSPILMEEGLAEYARLAGRARLLVEKNAFGRPTFPPGEEIDLSLSHAGNLFVLAIGPGRIGVDVEKETEERDRVRERYFSPEEKSQPFALVWTGKEAVGKLCGHGLSQALRCRVTGDVATLDGVKYSLFRHREGEYLITVAKERRP